MILEIHVPDEIMADLRREWGDALERAAYEALVIETYRSRRGGESFVRRALGLSSRWAADRWLAERNVYHNYSIEDLEADRATLDRLLGPERGTRTGAEPPDRRDM